MANPKGNRVNCVVFSTALLEPGRRTLAYGRWISPIADVYPIGDDPIDASITMYDLGQITIARTSSSPARYVRNRDGVRHGQFDDCALLRLSQGGEVRGDFGGPANVEIHEGDIYLSDLSQAVDLQVGKSEHLNLLVPRRALGSAGRLLHGRLLREGRLPCRMLTRHLLHLFEHVADPGRTPASILSQTTLAVLRKCLGTSLREQGSQLWAETLQARVLAHIELQLGDAELGAATLQRRFHISRTHLYRLFEGAGGVAHCIQERRLQAAFQMLDGDTNKSILEISSGLGFHSERQFKRAFRARFGITASTVRSGLFEPQLGSAEE
ncbi:helix-turn-helix domain-containing protein [Rhodanobacter sp. Col0626]|uniref:helix-turn-helix domain-containing protein n=1 Tax=Rhodanobacter sp. Col0626 TaxID=3415679 RepID=UPI003CEC98B5